MALISKVSDVFKEMGDTFKKQHDLAQAELTEVIKNALYADTHPTELETFSASIREHRQNYEGRYFMDDFFKKFIKSCLEQVGVVDVVHITDRWVGDNVSSVSFYVKDDNGVPNMDELNKILRFTNYTVNKTFLYVSNYSDGFNCFVCTLDFNVK